MNIIASARSNSRPLVAAGVALAVGTLALVGPLAAETYGSKISNDMSLCAPGKGPAVRVDITGLKSADGNLFVRTYHARKSDWLKSRRYFARVDTVPRSGSMAVCVPLPSAGDYALTVQHDINGNRKKDLSVDGVGMSNNPKVKTFLGIPRPPKLDKTRFSAGAGVTRVSVEVRYRD